MRLVAGRTGAAVGIGVGALTSAGAVAVGNAATGGGALSGAGGSGASRGLPINSGAAPPPTVTGGAASRSRGAASDGPAALGMITENSSQPSPISA